MSTTVRFSDGDIDIGSTGEQFLITGAEKAAQDLLFEILLPYDAATDRGCELFSPNGNMVVLSASGDLSNTGLVRLYLQNACSRAMRAQRANPRTSRDELISSIPSIVVKAGPDPRELSFVILAYVQDKKVNIARKISMRHIGYTGIPEVGGSNP